MTRQEVPIMYKHRKISIHSPIGKLELVEDGKGICRLSFGFDHDTEDILIEETPLLQEGRHQLEEYFTGIRKEFALPLSLRGTEFQIRDWQALCKIPYGETRTYGEIAREIGCPKGSRAVGMANRNNPIAIIIPCHRVIGANGSLTGYAGKNKALNIKEFLLKLEGAIT